MGQKDAAEKILEDYQDVFADILNVLVFTGDQDYEKLKLSKDQGGINMCVVLQEAIERGRKQGIECGKREGIERGKSEGIQQGRSDAILEIAAGMLRKNLPIKDICELTGLTKEQIRALVK